jgi:hypothetical protein
LSIVFAARAERLPAGHVDCAGKVRLLELVLLAHVDEHVAVPAARGEVVDLSRVDLPDLLFDLSNQLCAAGHRLKTPEIRSPLLQ